MERPDQPVSDDPHMRAVARFIDQIVEKVEAGDLTQADAYAVLAADTLGMSMQDHVAPATADALLLMAQTFAVQRYAMVNAAGVEIPDDIGGLE